MPNTIPGKSMLAQNSVAQEDLSRMLQSGYIFSYYFYLIMKIGKMKLIENKKVSKHQFGDLLQYI